MQNSADISLPKKFKFRKISLAVACKFSYLDELDKMINNAEKFQEMSINQYYIEILTSFL